MGVLRSSGRAQPRRGRGFLGALLLVAFGGCGRDFESPFLPGSAGYAGRAWTTDYDGDGIADSVAKYAPGCLDTPKRCLNKALAVARGDGPRPVTSISAPDLALTIGRSKAPRVAILPPEASQSAFALASGDPGVARIRDSLVVGASLGTTQVTVTALDGSGKSGFFKVTVGLPADKLEARDLECEAGGPARGPDLVFSPAGASDTGYALDGGNVHIAFVTGDGRRIQPVGPGATRMEVVTEAGLTDEFTVTVRAAIIHVRAVEVEDMDFAMAGEGGSTIGPEDWRRYKKPVVAWTPANASDKGYSLTSANPRVVQPDGRWVKAVGWGETTVTLTTDDGGIRAAFRVTVGPAADATSLPQFPAAP